MKQTAPPLRVALYPRVSTEEQFEKGYSLSTQEEVLVDYANEHGYKIVGIYRDEGHSARKPAQKRKAIQDLLVDVRAGKIDRILFIKLDRWFRNVKEYYKLQEVLDEHGVSWQATMEDYSTDSADGRLKVNLMLSIAENESDRTSERIKFVNQGKRRRKEWCFPGGPSQWPYGYMPQVIDGKKRCVKDPQTAPIVQDFWDYVVKYNSVRKAGIYVAEKYGITRHYRSWTVTSRNELYTGTFRGVDDYCEPYISRADWERIILGHELIKKTQRPERVYLFTGMLLCPCCGNTLKATFKTYPNNRDIEYKSYRCNNGRLRTCSYRGSPSEKKIEAYLLAHIREELETYIVQTELSQKERQPTRHAQDLVRLNEQLRRLNVIFMSGNLSDEEYLQQQRQLNTAIASARTQQQQSAPADLSPLKAFLASDSLALYDTLSLEDRRRLWRSIISKIHITGNQVESIDFRLN